MVRIAIALAAGLLFGVGLTVSQMVNPAKVLGFLDIGGIVTGAWDPSLAFVMGGALLVTLPGFRWILRRPKPVLAESFSVPTNRTIDRRLLAGALIFGAGWGLVGYCPGPAVSALAFGLPETFGFVAAMLIGMLIHRFATERLPRTGTA